MKMDEMNAFFESKGFTVERNHSTIDGKSMYKFKIEKDGRSVTRTFEYPGGVATHIKNLKQEDFIVDTLRVFETLYPGAKFDLVQIDQSVYPKQGIDFHSIWTDGSIFTYHDNDIKTTEEMWTKMNPYVRSISGHHPWGTHIKNVIFNDPATIVFWSDGSKTVVKCQDDDWFDPEKGLAMAISKKALGNKGNYCNELKKWLPEEEEPTSLGEWEIKIPQFYKQVSDIQKKVYEAFGLKKDTKLESVQKAYEILVKARDCECVDGLVVNDVIGYLGQALEE